MRNLAALAPTVVPLLVLTAPADARKPRCRVAKGGTALEHTRRVLVYQREDQVNACLRPSGRRYNLGTDDGLYNTVTIDAIRGVTVTWTASYTPECKADCPPDVHGSTATHTINLRTGAMT
jgi:hypothetical protein